MFSVLIISNSWPIDFWSQFCLIISPSYLFLHLASQLFLQKSQLLSLPASLLTKPPACNLQFKKQNYLLLSSSFNFSKTSLYNLCFFCAIDFTSFFYSESWVPTLFNNPQHSAQMKLTKDSQFTNENPVVIKNIHERFLVKMAE